MQVMNTLLFRVMNVISAAKILLNAMSISMAAASTPKVLRFPDIPSEIKVMMPNRTDGMRGYMNRHMARLPPETEQKQPFSISFMYVTEPKSADRNTRIDRMPRNGNVTRPMEASLSVIPLIPYVLYRRWNVTSLCKYLL